MCIKNSPNAPRSFAPVKTRVTVDLLTLAVPAIAGLHLLGAGVNVSPHSIIRYNLACYACQLGNLKLAHEWLGQAIDMAGTKEIKLMALDDHDLEPLWWEIGKT